ncbi:hypothetical protein VCO01S_31450 [Vibrio comitans NBRC 102076]|uniref:Uncharacterized protein n=1 Tax=Vibrio comitans NBRC 102076 TaxID=1219078 RepID=A0A4Y3IS62_9VIBR|nr:hypothetical protein VCO01S_31450 [Vibrio comitans NBRC 102076]
MAAIAREELKSIKKILKVMKLKNTYCSFIERFSRSKISFTMPLPRFYLAYLATLTVLD